MEFILLYFKPWFIFIRAWPRIRNCYTRNLHFNLYCTKDETLITFLTIKKDTFCSQILVSGHKHITLSTFCLQSNSEHYFHSCIPHQPAHLSACQIESPPQRQLHPLCPCIIRHTHGECAMTDYRIRWIMTPDTSVTSPWAATARTAAAVNKSRDEEIQRKMNVEGGGRAWMDRGNRGV